MTPSGTFVEFIQEKADFRPGVLFPYYPCVPKGTVTNREFRDWVIDCGAKRKADREAILKCCGEDLLFFINTFLWIKQESPVPDDLLFITWPKQDEYGALLCETRRAVEKDRKGNVRGDVLSLKPREVGWSWFTLAEGLQIARFLPGSTGLIGSRVETDVDAPGASKTLFWKLDYFIEHLPEWFMPEAYWKEYPDPAKRWRTSGQGKIKLKIPGFGTLLGGATQENFGRSGRFAWMMLDEFAHTDRGQLGMGDKIWAATTKTCRLRRVLSTPKGRSNKFAKLYEGKSLPIFTVQWFDDPAKTVGKYELEEEMTVGPVTLPKGGVWSPWAEATRKADDDDKLFAQEVLLSFEGTGGSFYDSMLSKVRYEQVKEPVWRGNLRLSTDGKPRVIGLDAAPKGYFSVWEKWRDGFLWPPGLYVAGIDVASGSRDSEGRGASNSVVAIGRIEGRKVIKVAEYATHGLLPHLFARIVCALGWCFPWPAAAVGTLNASLPAYAIWEKNGPGDMMGDVLVREHGYPNAYWAQSARGSHLGFQMQTFRTGDGTLAGSKVNVFNNHKQWLEMGWYQEPSFATYREMEQYRYTEDGGAEHAGSRGSLDPSEGRANHGDAVIATVLMLWAAKDLRDRWDEPTMQNDPPKMSVAWAQKKVRREVAGVWR